MHGTAWCLIFRIFQPGGVLYGSLWVPFSRKYGLESVLSLLTRFQMHGIRSCHFLFRFPPGGLNFGSQFPTISRLSGQA